MLRTGASRKDAEQGLCSALSPEAQGLGLLGPSPTRAYLPALWRGEAVRKCPEGKGGSPPADKQVAGGGACSADS